MLMMDTDVMIDIGRGYAPAVNWYNGLTGAMSVPGITVTELVAGCWNKAELAKVQKQVAPLAVVWPTEVDCRRALADFTQFHLSHSLGLTDALIAATAVGLSATLCTFNVKHFGAVPGLVTEQPYARP